MNENIVYRNNNYSGHGSMRGIDKDTPIEDVCTALAQYIIDHPGIFQETIDIVAQSMGGLVVRSMIKYNYTKLVEAGYRIDDVVLLTTPNRGTWLGDPFISLTIYVAIFLACLYYIERLTATMAVIIFAIIFAIICIVLPIIAGVVGGHQRHQMSAFQYTFMYDSFLRELNEPDETPYGIDDIDAIYRHVTWSTFRGNKFVGSDLTFFGAIFIFFVNPIAALLGTDGYVCVDSVPLEGARNHGPYPRNHFEFRQINIDFDDSLFEDLFSELTNLRV